MSRSKGSMSSKEAKDIATEIEKLFDVPYKYGINFLRAMEMLICMRISEQVNNKEDINHVCVEIPLLGDLEITHSNFHEKHRLTGEQSTHLEFNFKPSSGFKSDIIKAFNFENDICELFTTLYSTKLQEVYTKLREDGDL